jgi:hypothetical protein
MHVYPHKLFISKGIVFSVFANRLSASSSDIAGDVAKLTSTGGYLLRLSQAL